MKLCEGSLTALLERQSTDLRSTDECQWEAERRGASVIGQSGDLNVTLVSDQLQPPTFARTAEFVCNQRGHVLSAPENIANAGKKYFTDQQMVVFCLFLSCILCVYLTCSGATLVVRLRGVSAVNHPSAFFVFSRFSFQSIYGQLEMKCHASIWKNRKTNKNVYKFALLWGEAQLCLPYVY